MLDRDTCLDAMNRRDAAFDGRIFIGVKTTGIYCRPVCKARIPRPENVTFYPSAAAAEQAGYRPCLRCRPETAPFCPAWKGSLFVGALSGQQVQRLTFNQPGQAERRESLFTEMHVRFRDIEQSADGYLYLTTEVRYGSGKPDGTIIRLEPAQ